MRHDQSDRAPLTISAPAAANGVAMVHWAKACQEPSKPIIVQEIRLLWLN